MRSTGSMEEISTDDAIDKQLVLDKSARRMIPILFALATLAYLDRSNISFVAKDLKNDTGIDDEAYGFGVVAALFAVLGCDMSEGATLGGFYTLRFLLGALESGAFPSMYYYLTLVFEADELTIYYPRITLSTAVAGVFGVVVYW